MNEAVSLKNFKSFQLLNEDYSESMNTNFFGRVHNNEVEKDKSIIFYFYWSLQTIIFILDKEYRNRMGLENLK